MRFAHVIALSLLTVTSTVCFADDPKPSTRPPNINESHWIPITKTFGFVINKTTPSTTKITDLDGVTREYAAGPTTLTGYYMVLHDKNWCRLKVEPSPAGIIPLAQR